MRVKLYGKDGKLIGQKAVEMLPSQNSNSTPPVMRTSISSRPGKSYEGGTAEVTPEKGDGCVAVFATVIDNKSGSYATRAGEISAPRTSEPWSQDLL